MFMLLQMPSLFLSPFTGWMKDRLGTKVPCGVGFFLSAALLWTLGTSGPDGFSFIGSGSRGQTVYMISMLGLGIARTLITGCGVIEMTSKSCLHISSCFLMLTRFPQLRRCYRNTG
jgi:hypothetical protein